MVPTRLHNPPLRIADAVRRPEVVRADEPGWRGRCEACDERAAVSRSGDRELCSICLRVAGEARR